MRRRFSLRRLPRQPIFRKPVFRFLLALFLVWDTLHILGLYWHQAASRQSPPPPRNTKRIYIAAQHWNNARLLRERWNDALIALVKELGIDNVYVTIYESGSYDDTKGALRELDLALGQLQVERKITLSEVSHKDEITKQPAEHGWIKTPSGETALRRIPFLAKLRNQILHTLETVTSQGQHFDTVLFLNDVLFTVGVSGPSAQPLANLPSRTTSCDSSRRTVEIMPPPAPSTSPSLRISTTPSLSATRMVTKPLCRRGRTSERIPRDTTLSGSNPCRSLRAGTVSSRCRPLRSSVQTLCASAVSPTLSAHTISRDPSVA